MGAAVMDVSDGVTAVSALVELNEPETITLTKLLSLVYHGSGTIDIIVRKDGCERVFQGDWIARLSRLQR